MLPIPLRVGALGNPALRRGVAWCGERKFAIRSTFFESEGVQTWVNTRTVFNEEILTCAHIVATACTRRMNHGRWKKR